MNSTARSSSETAIWTAGASGEGGALHLYPAGSWGPLEADELVERDGRAWRRP